MPLIAPDLDVLLLARVRAHHNANLPTHFYAFMTPCCDSDALHVPSFPEDKPLYLNCAACDATIAIIAVAVTS